MKTKDRAHAIFESKKRGARRLPKVADCSLRNGFEVELQPELDVLVFQRQGQDPATLDGFDGCNPCVPGYLQHC